MARTKNPDSVTWCVYVHRNRENGKVYVGKTSRKPNYEITIHNSTVILIELPCYCFCSESLDIPMVSAILFPPSHHHGSISPGGFLPSGTLSGNRYGEIVKSMGNR